jgi:hypothetical protein
MEQRIDNTIHLVSTCPQTHNSWVHHWNNFPYPKTWLWDNNNNEGGKGFIYTEESMCNDLGFSGEVSKKHYWNSYGNRNIVWFYAHFRMLNFYQKFPNYDWYWFYDDDVTCDDWEGFINSFNNVDTDFLTWLMFSKEDYGKGIRKIDEDTTSQHMWFERFPGEGDKLPWWINEYYGSFFPVVRYSNTALNTLLQQFRWGLSGYSEGFVPTILNGYNHSLGSIFNKDGSSPYYDVNKINLKHKHQNIGWDWI